MNHDRIEPIPAWAPTSPELRDSIVRLRKDGHGVRSIARILDIYPSRVHRAIANLVSGKPRRDTVTVRKLVGGINSTTGRYVDIALPRISIQQAAA